MKAFLDQLGGLKVSVVYRNTVWYQYKLVNFLKKSLHFVNSMSDVCSAVVIAVLYVILLSWELCQFSMSGISPLYLCKSWCECLAVWFNQLSE